MMPLSSTDARVAELLYAGAELAYAGEPSPIQVCCSCATHTHYGCTVPLADGSEPFACADCNANPVCWPDGDHGSFVPLPKGGRRG